MRRALALVLCLAGCSAPVAQFPGPAINPLEFFIGHETSWGVEENRAGAPIAIVTTDCEGVATGPHRIRMVQVLHVGDAKPQTRIWQFTQVSPQIFTATANDMDGATQGVVAGREFHWSWVLESKPGNSLANISMEQYMYRMDDGSVMIRTIARKLGVRLVEVSEVFTKAGS